MSLPTTVRSLASRLRRPSQPYTTRRDRAIARQLHITFERDLAPTAVEDLHFYTYKGIVTIYGTVRHPLDQDLLVAVVRGIPGVRDVAANFQMAEDVKGQKPGDQ